MQYVMETNDMILEALPRAKAVLDAKDRFSTPAPLPLAVTMKWAARVPSAVVARSFGIPTHPQDCLRILRNAKECLGILTNPYES